MEQTLTQQVAAPSATPSSLQVYDRYGFLVTQDPSITLQLLKEHDNERVRARDRKWEQYFEQRGAMPFEQSDTLKAMIRAGIPVRWL